MQIGDFRLRFPPMLTLGALAVLALFLVLGNWQLDRAQEKRALIESLRQRSEQPVRDLPSALEDPQQWRYQRVRVTGHLDGGHQFLLDNRVSRGQVGLQVLTPLRMAHVQQAVLIDRGWVPLGPDRAQTPDIQVTGQRVELSGTVYVPYKDAYHLGDLDEGQSDWPRVIQYLDFHAISRRLGYPVLPLTIRLDPAAPHGYRREWPDIPFTPQRHLGYAIQWFALAAVLVVIYLALNIRRVRRGGRVHER
jgi:surfeit locus 1 family protein